MLDKSKSPMKILLAKVPSRDVSRAASVSSSAARWPLDIFDVSIRSRGSSGFGAGSLVAIISVSLFVKFLSIRHHTAQKRAGSEIGCSRIRKFFHRIYGFRDAQRIGITQWPTPEWSKTGTHYHGKIDICSLGDDLLLQATGGFVDHKKNHSFLQRGARCA